MKTFQDVMEWMQAQDQNGEYIGTPDTPENREAIAATLSQWLEDLGSDRGPKAKGILSALSALAPEKNKLEV